MSDAEALMAAIAADPKNDLPRLVYADYLEENGDPDRAEFIRIQCELHRNADGRGNLGPDDYADLHAREQALRDQYEEEWLAPLRRLGASSNLHGHFSRGFVNDLVMDAGAFIRKGAELWRHSPVEALILNNLLGHSDELAAREFLGRPARLHLSGRKGVVTPELRTILESEYLRPLRGLSLDSTGLSDADADSLTFAATNLATFSVSGWVSSSYSFAELVRALPPVERFSVSREGNGTELDLGIALGTLNASRLSSLSVMGTSFNERAARAVASARFSGLKELWLRFMPLGAETVETLAGSRHLESVSRIDLDGTEIGDRGLAEFAEWTGLRAVQSLMLRGCGIGPQGIAALTTSPHLARIEKVNLDGNAIGNAGLATIARCPAFAPLQELALRNNNISTDGLTALANATGWDGLRHLELNDNSVGEEAILRLAAAPHVRPLRWLSVSKCGVTEVGERTLLRALSNLRVFHADSGFHYKHGLRDRRRRALAEAGA